MSSSWKKFYNKNARQRHEIHPDSLVSKWPITKTSETWCPKFFFGEGRGRGGGGEIINVKISDDRGHEWMILTTRLDEQVLKRSLWHLPTMTRIDQFTIIRKSHEKLDLKDAHFKFKFDASKFNRLPGTILMFEGRRINLITPMNKKEITEEVNYIGLPIVIVKIIVDYGWLSCLPIQNYKDWKCWCGA